MRLQRLRTKGSHLPPGTICVSRPTRWGNPFDWQTIMDEYGCTETEAKRCARDIQHATELSEAQRRHLIRLAWRYRRQMPRDLVPSKDTVEAMDHDWNLRRKAEAERKAADKVARRMARRIARDGGVQRTFDDAQLARIGVADD